MPNRKYDPVFVVTNFIASKNIRQFVHELDKLDDLLERSSTYSMVLLKGKEQLTLEEKGQFAQYFSSLIVKLPLQLL